MKVFTYEYDIRYGQGAGVVVAGTKEEAIEIINHELYCTVEDLKVTELDISKPTIVDMSWEE